MAIYPFSNAYVVNKDVSVGSSFKAGMILMMNSAGNVVPADSQLLANLSIGQKQSLILGIAAGDSNVTGNTIIVPDYIGNNYLDSNSNFVSVSDREYLTIRRQLLDYADETVNEYYNINYSPKPKRTGIGVYSLDGDTFATDQFNNVLHGDYGVDEISKVSLNPGDLLTIGGGVNAGKLVKVNINSLGPDVLIVGIVDKYNSQTGLLYFRYLSEVLSMPKIIYMYVDAAQALSYPGSGGVWYDLSGNALNLNLVNGVSYSSANYGILQLDGTNDYMLNSTFKQTTNPHSIMGASRYSGSPRGRIFSSYGNNWLLGHWNNQNPAYHAMGWVVGPGSGNNNNWQISTALENYPTDTWTYYLNGSLIASNGGGSEGPDGLAFGYWAQGGLGAEISQAEIGFFIVYNRILTNTESINEYNRYKWRYSL